VSRLAIKKYWIPLFTATEGNFEVNHNIALKPC